MSKLICVKFTVGGNYNSTYDNETIIIYMIPVFLWRIKNNFSGKNLNANKIFISLLGGGNRK